MSRDNELLGAVGIERTLSFNKYHQLSKSFPISRTSGHKRQRRRDAGYTPPAIFGQPGTKCLISPPKFVKIVIKLPAEQCNQRLWYKQDTHIQRESIIVLVLHEL